MFYYACSICHNIFTFIFSSKERHLSRLCSVTIFGLRCCRFRQHINAITSLLLISFRDDLYVRYIFKGKSTFPNTQHPVCAVRMLNFIAFSSSDYYNLCIFAILSPSKLCLSQNFKYLLEKLCFLNAK